MYIVGFDGGGTKTHCLIGDTEGNILSKGIGGPANYQTAGKDRAKESLIQSFEDALSKTEIDKSHIVHFSFGLAGADEEEDFVHIKDMIKDLVGSIDYEIYHDSWIGLRSASIDNVGVVAICGTGTGYSGRRRDGRSIQLRNLSYELGNKGGGDELSRDALHHAFRSEEGTGPYTLLEEELPLLFKAGNMDQVGNYIRKVDYSIPESIEKSIPPLINELANCGDRVCQNMLIEMGRTLGRYSASVIKKLELEEEDEIPLILIGSLYKGSSQLLINAMKLELSMVCSNVKLIRPVVEPVYGAYYLGLDRINKKEG